MEAPYGSWTSPIGARQIAEGGVGLGWPQAVGEAVYWVETRPTEEGRSVVVRHDPDGTIADVTPPGVNTRTLVHEYGGGMYRAFRNDAGGESVVFSDFADQRLYRQDLLPAEGGEAATSGAARWSAPRPITPDPPAPRAWRYADADVTPDGRSLVCVRERHGEDGVVNDLVALPTDGRGAVSVVASGHDFYAAPRLDAAGRRVAYLSWDHPLMPWDGTELHVVGLSGDGPGRTDVLVAGGEDEAVVQPSWSAGGDLVFVSDRSSWWNLYLWRDGADVLPVAPLEAEFAKPMWVFGLANHVLLPDGRRVAFFTRDGVDRLARLDGDVWTELPLDDTAFVALAPVGRRVATIAASATHSWAVLLVDPRDGSIEVVRRSRDAEVDERYLSRPEPIAFPTCYEPDSVTGPLAAELARAAAGRDGEPELVAHALYFPPANPDFSAPPGEKPPLLVISHGGPTSAHETNLSMDIQYWTSRGFAVVDVNYGGSSGYGRAYRERLKGNWGVVDTVDCIRAAEYLAARGDVDPRRLAVRGASAGGYTTLNALTRFTTFAAGASYFGLADLESFVAGGTHKFEERYLISLVGPHPERADVYRDRSPIHHVDAIACPVILLQGLEDVIVPPAQAEIIAGALAAKGLPYAYLAFAGEQHGFRKAANIVRSLEAELHFYGRVLGFAPADDIEPVAIANLPD
jgi:dipeptidyl aminopeptidase/acylaminoacyl peptidase